MTNHRSQIRWAERSCIEMIANALPNGHGVSGGLLDAVFGGWAWSLGSRGRMPGNARPSPRCDVASPRPYRGEEKRVGFKVLPLAVRIYRDNRVLTHGG